VANLLTILAKLCTKQQQTALAEKDTQMDVVLPHIISVITICTYPWSHRDKIDCTQDMEHRQKINQTA
jgi:hypothetical protein